MSSGRFSLTVGKKLFNKMKIQAKLQAGFLTAGAIMLLRGGSSYTAMRSVDKRIVEMSQVTPLLTTATEMELLVSKDHHGLLAMQQAGNTGTLVEEWTAHIPRRSRFDTLYSASMEGGTTSEGMVYAATDSEVRDRFDQAQEFQTPRPSGRPSRESTTSQGSR